MFRVGDKVKFTALDRAGGVPTEMTGRVTSVHPNPKMFPICYAETGIEAVSVTSSNGQYYLQLKKTDVMLTE